MTLDSFKITFRPYRERGKWWVEETIGEGSVHKILYGPMPDRNTTDELILERKQALQQTWITIAQQMQEKLLKPKLVA